MDHVVFVGGIDCVFLFVDDLLTMKACPPPEEEFVDLFQKMKYSFSLMVRLRHGTDFTLDICWKMNR